MIRASAAGVHTATPTARVCARCGGRMKPADDDICRDCVAVTKTLAELETWTGRPDLCAHGHRCTPETTVWRDGDRGRQCAVCIRETNRRAKRRQKERGAA